MICILMLMSPSETAAASAEVKVLLGEIHVVTKSDIFSLKKLKACLPVSPKNIR